MRTLRIIFTILLFTAVTQVKAQNEKDFTLQSPDGRLSASITVADQISFTLSLGDALLAEASPIALQLNDGQALGEKPRLRNHEEDENRSAITPLYGKRSSIEDNYNALQLNFRGGYSLHFRLYDEGLAYRFATGLKGDIIVQDETLKLHLPKDPVMWAMYSNNNSFQHSYESFYTVKPLSQQPDSLAALPVLAEVSNGVKLLITEADLQDYPGFHLQKTDGDVLSAEFPQYPLSAEKGGHYNFNMVVKERADYIAKTNGTRTFPWRVLKVATDDVQLLDTDLVYKLSAPADASIDFSWVKPGKVAWDWWNAINLTGVDFKAGINTESYKYFIDFAANHGIEYINLDEGWSDQFDLKKLSEEVDLKEILAYAKSKGVGVFLWAVHWPLDQKLDEYMEWFQELGVAGLKIDFMDRDDQKMIDFYWRVAEAAAANKLLVNYHGAYKPAGLHRTWPNVVNREAVRGLEFNKFSKPDGTTPEHAATIPFIRMAAGPLDYTPGAMKNAQKENFGVFFEQPMSQGTRGQQLALFVVFEAPLQMLSDAPTAYLREPEILEFLSAVPTVWHDTKALSGKVGDYAVIARKHDDEWWVGGITDWDARTLEVNFNFLPEGQYKATIYQDGINADRDGTDYARVTKTVSNETSLSIDLAPGGGFAMRIQPVQ